MTSNELKAFCKKMGLTYKELAELIGYGEGAIKTAVSTDNVSRPMESAINLYNETLKLKAKLKEANKAKEILKTWIKS